MIVIIELKKMDYSYFQNKTLFHDVYSLDKFIVNFYYLLSSWAVAKYHHQDIFPSLGWITSLIHYFISASHMYNVNSNYDEI